MIDPEKWDRSEFDRQWREVRRAMGDLALPEVRKEEAARCRPPVPKVFTDAFTEEELRP